LNIDTSVTFRPDREEREVLRHLGLDSIEQLFSDIPEEIRCTLEIPEGMEEAELVSSLKSILGKNKTSDDLSSFLGGGVYNHHVPSAVDSIISRSEFYTSYTPYQPEISQGILQALFEYQSLICELTGMDAANTSMYDGASALGEACLMASRINGKKEVVVPRVMSREKDSVLHNYCRGPGILVKKVGYDKATGRVDLAQLSELITGNTSAVYLESPNYFGVLEEEVEEIRNISKDCALIVGANPLSLAVLKPPGDFGADIVVGEGQPVGLPMNFGGSLLGVFACRKEHIRKMPGRVVGQTKDSKGRRAFCLTLQAREQHIRRGKATSNICTNESLCALASAACISLLGGEGLRKRALKNMRTARETMERIDGIAGYEAPLFKAAHFNEFVVRSEKDWPEVNAQLLGKGVHSGIPLANQFPELGNSSLFAVTELTRAGDIDKLIKALEGVQ
jgi:glycine dehydrogenase subunit 1